MRNEIFEIQRTVPLSGFKITLWGVPADPKNDGVNSFNNIDEFGAEYGRFLQGPPNFGAPRGTSSNWPLRPFLQAPARCGVPLETKVRIEGYDHSVTEAASPWPAATGCGQLSFNPSLAANPTTTDADTASGVDIRLTVPQFLSPTVPSPSQIRANTVVLPEGFSINSNAAQGKTSCSDEQARFGTQEAAQCPEHAKVGTLEVESSALPGILPGAIYLGEPKPGNRYRLILVMDGFGLHYKLPGTVTPDPETGQLTTTFENLPQNPFQEFRMHFFGSERGALATPTRCGRYPVETTFTPWVDELPTQTSTQFFEITSGPGGKPCPSGDRPFDPEFDAASDGNTAGAHTPFAVDLKRDDGEQFLAGLNVSTPLGFSGKLAGIPYCPESDIAMVENPLYSGISELTDSACPTDSLVGHVVAGAGAGSRPLHQDGKVYLAGPYKSAPLSLLVVIPAVSGPYDLGNIAVRVQVQVDPTTGRVTTVSDPLPQIIEGVPLRARQIRVDIDREEFALNPTNCRPLSTDAQVSGAEGATSTHSAHFQVANCGVLDFSPRLGIRLRGQSARNGHPSLQAVLGANDGDANIARSAVVLPRTTLLDQGNLNNICTREQFANNSCPPNSVYGRAAAVSPLLDEPLRGPVYLRANGGARQLPDLVADLKGQVDFELVGFVDSVRGGLRTIFAGVPDVPVSKFVLRMQGGARKGLIVNSTDLCRNPSRARVAMRGQNGKRRILKPRLRARCGRASKSKRKRRAGVSLARKVASR